MVTGPPSARVTNDPHWRSPNVKANTDTTPYAQQEPAIAVNPLNHLNVVAAQKDERSAPGPNTATKEIWIDTSTDGGVTWINTHIPMPGTNLPQQSDPVVTFSDNNVVYVTIIGLSNAGGLGTNATMVAHSTDGGLTWPTPAVFLNQGQGGSDKEWTGIDLNPASPYYRRVYVTWTNFALGPQFIEKWSSDSGVTWNPPGGSNYVTVSFGSYDSGQFSMPVVLPNGNVIVTWNAGGVIAVGKSTDGGQSFINPNTAAVSITNANSVPGASWRINTIPSTAASQATGTLVTTWTDGRNGKDDIYFSRSTNGGTSWSAAARVAHNAAGSSYQVEPWISVAPGGRFDVIWYDDRDFPSNLNTFHVYSTHSTDDGATWTGPDEQVTDASTNLNVGIPQGSGWNGAAGDYINVTSMDDMAYAIWTDTRSSTNEDVYTSRYLPVQGTPTATATVPVQPTSTATGTATVAATSTVATSATSTAGPSNTAVANTATRTAAPTNTVGATSTPCSITFTDVQPSDYFYVPVQYLYCHGVISGYADNTFRPYNNTTRAQMVKIVVLGFNKPIATPAAGGYTFTDVPPSQPFFQYIETAAAANIVSGYACGGPGEPCDAQNRPYFRPNAYVTRGQLAKIDVVAAGWALQNPANATFADVAPNSTFYTYVETAYCHGVISGYTCGSPGEPCDPQNRPYFRQFNDATRGQISKIVYLSIGNGQGCAGVR